MIFAPKRKLILLSILVIILTVTASKVQAQQVDDLVFYEGNGCTQGIVFAYNSYKAADDNCKKRSACKGDNDEARSLRIGKSVKQGAKIVVFDNPGGSTQDDYTTIDIINRSFIQPEGYCLRSFEQTFDNPNANSGIRVDHFHQNGLDGKVSRVKVIPGS
ncbi:hypothetical protein DSM106972_087480 [Dulcicalothrix desertica PCC 7102]|uniref:Secreted protein n=1 Tax=Dulcicalothrix desertica PCC 7102 TaxID=232991 RepID=A0A3S1A9U2_9CYAN|nr:hypothetical protein [Dulcicalothrix desertica]RUS96561.1 hypothetical protein DSM106972_087480 [Dulcicalothrix desertica PCC 7102]TWH51400.1 hypothetical protein CAL7102_05813 [Dulcicalothrix desertica PCC 7102]